MTTDPVIPAPSAPASPLIDVDDYFLDDEDDE